MSDKTNFVGALVDISECGNGFDRDDRVSHLEKEKGFQRMCSFMTCLAEVQIDLDCKHSFDKDFLAWCVDEDREALCNGS